MAGIPAKLERFLAGLELLQDRNDRIQFLIATADGYREVPEEVASRPFADERRVPHCESEAFVWAIDQPDGSLKYHFAVENPQGISAKAMAAILDQTVSGAPLEEVVAIPGDLPLEIFGRELSMGKNMGLTSLLGMVQAEARRRLTSTS